MVKGESTRAESGCESSGFLADLAMTPPSKRCSLMTHEDVSDEIHASTAMCRQEHHKCGGTYSKQERYTMRLSPLLNASRRRGNDKRHRRFRPSLNQLEYRIVLSQSYIVSNTIDSGPGSLRQAILNADANDSVPSTIVFNIPETDPGYADGVFTIQPLSQLPVLGQNITIDGTTQTAFTGNTNPYGPVILLNGAEQSSGDGLELDDDNTVKDLDINGFQGEGIHLAYSFASNGLTNNDNQILDNYLGTEPTGTIAVPNGVGIAIVGFGSPSWQSTGNLIQGNLISGNIGGGIEIGDTNQTEIIGNLIGTDRTGSANLGNGGDGILLGNAGAPNNTISNNIIAFNQQDGIDDRPDYRYSVAYTTSGHQGNAFFQNSIFSNGMLGIDLRAPGTDGNIDAPQGVPLQNTPGGPHQGANLLQNYPVLNSAISSASSTVITGSLNSTPDETFLLEFFASPTANASGYGEGKTYLGDTSVTTDSSGNASFSVTVPVGSLVGQVLSATATDPNNNTSEFSEDITIQSAASATFLQLDSTTKGTWMGTYGSDGYDLVGGSSSLPSYATVSVAGNATYVWSADTTDERGLENPSSSSPSTNRIAAAWYSGSSFTVTLDLTDGNAHTIALYAVDWDKHGRSEQIQIANASTGTVLSTETLSSFTGGAYEVWTISGDVKITITELSGGNGLLNGIFFGPATVSPSSTPATVAVEGATATRDIGMTSLITPTTTAIGTVDSSGDDTTALPPPIDLSITARELVHDGALEEVLVERRRTRSLFRAVL